jgi:hypothetical protein
MEVYMCSVTRIVLCLLPAGILFGLFLNTEVGGSMYFRNVGELLDEKAHHSSYSVFWSLHNMQVRHRKIF